MPSFPVHLIIADMLCKRLEVRSRSDYFLGSIAPDSVNLNGFASQSLRYGAHIRSIDYDIWKKQLSDFYVKNKHNFAQRPDYLRGYVLHCVTDIAWDETVQPQLFEFLQSGGQLSHEQLSDLKWEELFRLNSVLLQREDLRKAIDELKTASALDIATVSAQQVAQYRDYVVNDYKDKIISEPPGFLSTRHIDLCAERTLELFKRLAQ